MIPRSTWVAIPAGAVLCLVLIHSGTLSFLFLLPLGLAACCTERRNVWPAAFLAAGGNIVWTVIQALSMGIGAGAVAADVFYFTVMVLAFAWVVASPEEAPFKLPWFLRMRTSFRMVVASVAGALSLVPFIMSVWNDEAFYAYFKGMSDAVIAALAGAGEAGAQVQTDLYVNGDTLIDMLVAVILRGGVLVWCLVLFYASRQLSVMAGALVRRTARANALRCYHVDPAIIWALAAALLAIFFGVWLGAAPLEIVGCNVLVICTAMYLAQGVGIVQALLTRLLVPLLGRIVLYVLAVIVIFSPGINLLALGALCILGVIENWIPLRMVKQEGT